MTRKLDFTTGRPVWYAYRAPPVPAGRLIRDVKADIGIIDMHFSCEMMAEALIETGNSTIYIDRRRSLLGLTSATTALVQFEIGQPLSELSRQIGRQKTERA